MDNAINQEAIGLLDRAGCDFPKTKEETLKMQELLAQAWNAAEDREEAAFKDKYDRLNEIVRWSLAKHRTWQWPLIIGALLFAALLLWGGVSNKDAIQSAKERIKTIRAWAPCDTVITWESCGYPASDAESMAEWRKHFDNANLYKAYNLREWKRRYLQNKESSAGFSQKAENESDKEKKNGYLKQAKYWSEAADEYKEKFDRLAPQMFKDVQKTALEQVKGGLGSERFMRNFLIFNFLLVLLLVGLYIWTGYPYGYEITKARTRNKILGWIRKACMWFVGITLGAGIVQKLFADDIVWQYSDGHRETESDVAGTAMNIIWKLGLIAVGLIAFIVLSGLLMFIETAFAIPVKLRELKG